MYFYHVMYLEHSFLIILYLLILLDSHGILPLSQCPNSMLPKHTTHTHSTQIHSHTIPSNTGIHMLTHDITQHTHSHHIYLHIHSKTAHSYAYLHAHTTHTHPLTTHTHTHTDTLIHYTQSYVLTRAHTTHSPTTCTLIHAHIVHTHSTNEFLSTQLGTEVIAVNKTNQISCPCGAYIKSKEKGGFEENASLGLEEKEGCCPWWQSLPQQL